MKHLYIVLILLFSSSSMLFGQLEKGDWMLGGYNSMTTNHGAEFELFQLSQKTIQLSNKVGLMITDRTMLGVDVSVTGNLGAVLFLPDHFVHYDLNMFMRNYAKKRGRFLPFFELQAGFEKRRATGFFRKNGDIFKANMGLGVLQFIAPNIAIEAMIGARIIENGDINRGSNGLFDFNPERIYAKIGLKTFLKSSFLEKVDIRDKYLKQGSFFISGSGNIRDFNANEIGLFFERHLPSFPEQKGVQFSFHPRVEYFKTDHLTIGGGLDFELLTTGAGYRLESGINFKSSIYLRLKGHFFFAPSVGVGYNRRVANADAFTPGVLTTSPFTLTRQISSIQVLEVPVDIRFRWFLGRRMLLSFGGLYETKFIESRFISNTTNVDAAYYTSLEYFFAPNLSMEMRVAHNRKISQASLEPKPLSLNNSTDLSFKVSYFIFQ